VFRQENPEKRLYIGLFYTVGSAETSEDERYYGNGGEGDFIPFIQHGVGLLPALLDIDA
jgi:hypothetical protein